MNQRVTGTCQECGHRVSYGGSRISSHLPDGSDWLPASQGHKLEDRCPGSYRDSVETEAGRNRQRPMTAAERRLSRSIFGG